MPNEVRLCIRCSKYKNSNDFYKSRRKVCKECVKIYQNKYNALNKDKIQERRDSIDERIRQKNYYRMNAAEFKERAMARHASLLQRTPKWLTPEQLLEIKNIYIEATEMTEQLHQEYEVDHMIPLQGENVSGLHVPWNLRIITRRENRSKKNKLLLRLRQY